MLKEGAYTEDNAEISIEHTGGFSEKSLTDFLETHHSIANSGNNGIILKFLREELPPEVQETLEFDPEDNSEGSISIKVLKVYNLENAEKEFNSLQEARKIVKDQKDSAPIARVPKATGFYDIKVSEKLQKTLNENGASIVDGKVGLIVMDYIEGVDLATLLYQEALERLHMEGDIYEINDVQSMPFDELSQLAATKLRFSKPGGKSRNENEQRFEEERVKAENAKKLFTALEKNGFVLPHEIVEQLGNTVKLWHKNNFYHNDFHERQVIIKDRNLDNPQSYAIDYGTASNKSESTGDPNVKPMDDEELVRRLTPLTKLPEEKKREQEEDAKQEWDKRVASLDQQPKAQRQYESLKDALEKDNLNALEGNLIAASISDDALENFLGNLLKLFRENEGYRGRIQTFLSSHANDKKSKMRSFVINRIQSLQRAIEG